MLAESRKAENARLRKLDQKRCGRCLEIKALAQFQVHRTNHARYPRGYTGRQSYCQSCQTATRALDVVGNLLRGARRRARQIQQPYTLMRTDIVVPEFCPILGIRLQPGKTYGRDASPSLDRVNNNAGYIPENVVVVSWRANRIKSDATPAELRAVADYYDKVNFHAG